MNLICQSTDLPYKGLKTSFRSIYLPASKAEEMMLQKFCFMWRNGLRHKTKFYSGENRDSQKFDLELGKSVAVVIIRLCITLEKIAIKECMLTTISPKIAADVGKTE